MGIKNWLLNRKLKKDREKNPHLYANLENYAIKYGEVDFETRDVEQRSRAIDKEIKKMERKIERYK